MPPARAQETTRSPADPAGTFLRPAGLAERRHAGGLLFSEGGTPRWGLAFGQKKFDARGHVAPRPGSEGPAL